MAMKIKNLINWVRAHYIISAVILVVLVFIGYKIFSSGNSKQELFTVEVGDVTQRVIVSGKTKAVHAVDLGFENNGKVSKSYVNIGSRVVVGQPLIALDQSEAYASYLRAQANLASEQAKLDEIKRGTRPEELAISETQVANAQTDLIDAQNNISAKILDAYSKSDDVIHNNADQFFSNPRTNPQLNLTTYDLQLKNDIELSRFQMESLLSDWKNYLSGTSLDTISKTSSNLSQVKSFLDKLANVVNSQTSNSILSQTTIDAYKASVSSARTGILTSISNLAAAEEKLNTAKSALTLAQRNLDLKKVGSTPEAIKSEEARVAQYNADLQSASAQLAKMTLYSPLSGVVTRQDAKVGEIMTPGKSVISIISDNDLEIESNVSEINIGKVSVGNPVDITLDAFPNEIFKGTVTYIEPAETIIDGVVNYKITVTFNEKYPQMKSGLTTNLDIKTKVKNGVIRIPQYSLIQKNSGTYVSKKVGEGFVEVPVTVGIVGQDGFAEVLTGLSVGEVINVVTPVI